ncbi:hypothetical protein MMC25_003492 [Agyrium rufum]|nr:hypothetical protein [Agyrium rufum]
MSNTQTELSTPPEDAISALQWSPVSGHLAVASWDKNVYIYDEPKNGSRLMRRIAHRAPVLDVCFGRDETEIYTACLDWSVRRYDLDDGEAMILSTHNAAVKSVAFSPEHNLLISASWDKTLHIHNLSHLDVPPSVISLPAKAFSITLSKSKLTVAMSTRTLYIYELSALQSASSIPSPDTTATSPSGSLLQHLTLEPWQKRESSLKFMIRSLSSMPTDLGYASSSIEGRVAVEWFDPSPESQSRKYAFKCHRQPSSDPSEANVDVVYPVNALAFHPVHGTFASGGGDGFVALWDAGAKRRIRQYQKFPGSVAALAFSRHEGFEGKWLAIGVCKGFEDGKEGDGDIEDVRVRVFVRELGEGEAKGKGGK